MVCGLGGKYCGALLSAAELFFYIHSFCGFNSFFLSSSINLRYWSMEVVGAYCEKEKGSKENIDNTAENLAF